MYVSQTKIINTAWGFQPPGGARAADVHAASSRYPEREASYSFFGRPAGQTVKTEKREIKQLEMRIFWGGDHDQPSKTETHDIKQLKTRIFWDGDHAGRPGKNETREIKQLETRILWGGDHY